MLVKQQYASISSKHKSLPPPVTDELHANDKGWAF